MIEEKNEQESTESTDTVARLQAELVKERETTRKAQETLKTLRSKMDERRATTEETVEAETTKVRTELESKLNQVMSERDSYGKRVRELSIVERGARAIASHRGITEMLLPHLREVCETDGEGRVFVKDANGKPRLRENWSSLEDYLPLEDYIGSLRDHKVWSMAFESNGASGASTQSSRNATTNKSSSGRLVKTSNGVQKWVKD